MLVVGLTGTFGAGHSTFMLAAKEHFADKALTFSTSDEVRREATARGLGLERPVLQKIANELRSTHGPGILGKRAAEFIAQEHKKNSSIQVALVDGIRNPLEVQALRDAFGKQFFLVAIDAPVESRYHRIKARKRANEHLLSLEEFKASEEKEMNSKEAHSQNISECMKLADITLYNTFSLEEYWKKSIEIVDKLLADAGKS